MQPELADAAPLGPRSVLRHHGDAGAAAIRNTIDLARLADGLGYRRYWVAEHHNLPSVASGAPEIMIGAIAAATTRIRASAPAA